MSGSQKQVERIKRRKNMPSKKPALAPTIKGFKLVAVADGVGLYRKDDKFATSKGYGLNTRHASWAASGYPNPPDGGRWRWLYEKSGAGKQFRRFVRGELIRI
jgi:hypothetical protein